MANTKNALSDAVQKFASAAPAPSEESVDAFNKFRTAVRQAAGKRSDSETLESLLGDLEPKEPTLRQLIDLCEKKRMYRKQIQAVFVEIVKVDSWLDALRNNASLTSALPEILLEIYELEKDRPVVQPPKAVETTPVRPVEEPAVTEGPAPVVAVAESSTVNTVPEDVSRPRSDSDKDRLIRQAVQRVNAMQAMQDAGKNASRKTEVEKPVAKRASVVETTLALLEKACQEMMACKYSADNREVAWETVQIFNRAVIQVVNSHEKEDDIALDACEPKDLILQFLVDIHERHHKYRSYVRSICNRLYNDDFSAWKEAIEEDSTVNSMVQDLVCDKKAEEGDEGRSRPSGIGAVPASALKSVKRAKVADARGSIGVLLVLVKSAHNLPNVDTKVDSLTDPFVRVTLKGGRIQRTPTIDDELNPKWNFPMDFEVPTLDSEIKFEVFHEDPKKEKLIGQVGLKASELPKAMARSFAEADVMRLALKGPSNAFIEIKLAFEPAPSLLDESEEECDGTVESFLGEKARSPEKYVAWVSVDPRKEGQPVPYPTEIATALELALSDGEDKVDISVAIPGASVLLNCYPFRQMTKSGSRYVARCEMAKRGDTISVYVASNSKKEWRLEDSTTPGASKRTEKIDASKVIETMANAAAREAEVARAEAQRRRVEGVSSSFSSAKSASFASGGGYPRPSDRPGSKGAGKEKFKAAPGGKSECTLQ